MKKKKPIIGIVGRVINSKCDDNLICAWEEIRLAVIKSGGVPLLILPTNDFLYDNANRNIRLLDENEKKDLLSIVDLCDGIIFQGGLSWYQFDAVVFQYALQKDIPSLGICAGMQMMACIDKYNSFLDLTRLNNTKINHKCPNVKYVHKINIEKDTILYNIVKEDQILVNSRHNYRIDGVNKFVVSAISEDGLIEAIEYPNKKFIVGIQWHPESMLEYDNYAKKIFLRFIKICQKSALFG